MLSKLYKIKYINLRNDR